MSEMENELQAAPGVWQQAFRRAFASRPFVVAVVIMVVTAFGMGAATSFLKLRFRKTPVELRQPLEKVPQQLGKNWVQVSTDEPLPGEIEQTLGTKQYIFRDYADRRIVGDTEIQEILNATGSEAKRRQIMITEGRKARGFIHLAVTYYTGMVDTVAHVPDRCYIADGYTPTEYEQRIWDLNKEGKKAGDDEKLSVRFINFEDATGISSRVNKNVAYFFQVNGEMENSPIAVRYRLQDLTRADVYYAKIELMSLWRNRNEAAKIMEEFLTDAMPEIRKCLPARSVAAATGPTTAKSE